MKALHFPDFWAFRSRHRLALLQAALIVVAAAWVFSPAFHGQWLWDDFDIRDNPTLHSSPGLGQIWFAPNSPDYYPLEESVLWVEWHLWHENVLGYHLANIGFHLASAFLIWRLLKRLGVRLAWLGGLLFVVHPLVVESVAWIAELKNTLSLPPLLLAMDAFIDYTDAAEAGAPKAGWHLLRSALLFLAAMLCKSSVVMFPVALLLYLVWRRGQAGWRDLRSIAPFLLISLALGPVTLYFQVHRAIGNWQLPPAGFAGLAANAGLNLWFYFSKCLFPWELIPIYPPWAVHYPSPLPFLPWIILAAGLGAACVHPTPWSRHVLFGAGWFVINLFPILGFMPMAYQHIAPVADHFAYVGIVGTLGLAAAGASFAYQHWKAARPFVVAGIAAACGLLAWESHRYSGVFLNQDTEWSYTLRHNSRSPMAFLNMAFALTQEGRIDEAFANYKNALLLDPDNPQTEKDAGDFLAESKRPADAVSHYERALTLDPAMVPARRNLAKALDKAGRTQEAILKYREILRTAPGDAEMETDLGKALYDSGERPDAIRHLRRGLQLESNNPEAENSLGLALASDGRTEDGIAHLKRALKLNPDFAEAHNNLGFALAGTGHPNDAIPQFEEALRLKPDFAQAHNNLGFALSAAGRRKEAIAHFEEALRIEPEDSKAHYNLAVLLELDNRIHEAVAHLREAVRLKPDSAAARSSLYRLEAIEMVGKPEPERDPPSQAKGGN